jgi:hypothetical protein
MQLLGSALRENIVNVHSNTISLTSNIIVDMIFTVVVTAAGLNRRHLARHDGSAELPS